ncbi:hypothetical protein AB4Z51_33445 [Bradyrhizobium sp. 2TAF36]|uniref:hypothetical protein n=1 Tax=Bradyrhizobium sp. MOS001 TaxID=2133948 RepID=UPI0031BA6ABF
MRLRRFDEALVIVDEAIHLANGSGAALELAELLRIQAEILAEKSQLGSHCAINAIRRSLEVGKQQAALAYQLRSATTFARLEDRQGRDHGARAIVRSI